VRWGVAGNIVTAWLLTLPAAAAVGAAVFGFTSIFGSGVLGPLLGFLLAAAAGLWLFDRRVRKGQPVPSS
jgi:PiT family inorganic phosphate transporter